MPHIINNILDYRLISHWLITDYAIRYLLAIIVSVITNNRLSLIAITSFDIGFLSPLLRLNIGHIIYWLLSLFSEYIVISLIYHQIIIDIIWHWIILLILVIIFFHFHFSLVIIAFHFFTFFLSSPRFSFVISSIPLPSHYFLLLFLSFHAVIFITPPLRFITIFIIIISSRHCHYWQYYFHYFLRHCHILSFRHFLHYFLSLLSLLSSPLRHYAIFFFHFLSSSFIYAFVDITPAWLLIDYYIIFITLSFSLILPSFSLHYILILRHWYFRFFDYARRYIVFDIISSLHYLIDNITPLLILILIDTFSRHYCH